MFLRAANFAAKKITAGGRLRPESKLFFTECPHVRFFTANVAVTSADEVTKMTTTPTTLQRFAPLDSNDYAPFDRCIRICVQKLKIPPDFNYPTHPLLD